MAGGVDDSLWLKIQRLWVAAAGQMIDSQDRCIAQRLFTHMSTTVYSQVLIYTLSRLRRREENENAQTPKCVHKGIRTRALSIASPAFYHWATALHI